jgi:hypothetical protein
VAGALSAGKAMGVVGVLAAVASMFKPQWAPATAPLYAVCKGVALAAMSAVLELSYPGGCGRRAPRWCGCQPCAQRQQGCLCAACRGRSGGCAPPAVPTRACACLPRGASCAGIAMNAVLLTTSTAASLFLALKTRLITVTDRFADTVGAARATCARTGHVLCCLAACPR